MDLQQYANNEQLQLEAVTLGSMISNNELIDECVLHPEEFIANPVHDMLYRVIRYARDDLNLETIDPIILTKLIVEKGSDMSQVGGVRYLQQIISATPTNPSFSYYQQKIRESYVEREIKYRTSEIMQSMGISGNVKQHLLKLQDEIEELQDMLITDNQDSMISIEDALQDFDVKIEEREAQGDIQGANMLSKNLLKMMGGHKRGRLTVIGARPAMGKTAFMVSDAYAITENRNDACLVFSAEMPTEQLNDRYVSNVGNIDSHLIKKGRMESTEWQKFFYVVEKSRGRHLYIDDNPKMSFEYIKRQTKKKVKFLRSNGINNIVIYVDYLSYIYSEKRFNEKRLEVGYMINGFKRMSRELDIHVVVLAQVGRQVETRQDKRPMNSDLKETGEIEQTADNILFLYRDDYYDRETTKKGIIEIIIGKQRDGDTGTVEMKYLRNFNKFIDIEV